MCPQTPQETQRWVLEWSNGRRRELGAHSLTCNISEVGGHVGALGWD
jgi:hypothetical protein